MRTYAITLFIISVLNFGYLRRIVPRYIEEKYRIEIKDL